MLDFRGEISEKSRWLKDPQLFESEEDNGVIYFLEPVTVDQWNNQLDANILYTFNCPCDHEEGEIDGFKHAINS